jgi:predicted TIM-barrel fold metal-dependent hydrolase
LHLWHGQPHPLRAAFYWPLYEAAQRKNLPLHFHPSTTAVIANAASTPAGMATTYLESHTCLPQFYTAYLASFIFEGVFEKFPGLRVAFVEGGVAWLPHLLWRMDKEFKALRQQAPFLKRLPSEYVKSNVRLTTQPIEEPRDIAHLMQIFNMIDGDEVLMYASDYPHFDFDEPSVIPKQLGESTLRKILHDNACSFFNLPQPSKAELATLEAS